MVKKSYAQTKYEAYEAIWNKRHQILDVAACTLAEWFEREYKESIDSYHARVEARKAELRAESGQKSPEKGSD